MLASRFRGIYAYFLGIYASSRENTIFCPCRCFDPPMQQGTRSLYTTVVGSYLEATEGGHLLAPKERGDNLRGSWPIDAETSEHGSS